MLLLSRLVKLSVLDDEGLPRAKLLDVLHVYHLREVSVEIGMDDGCLLVRNEATSINVKVCPADPLVLEVRVIYLEEFKFVVEPLQILLNLCLVDLDVFVQVVVLVLLVDCVQGHEAFLGLHREAGRHAAAQVL